MSVWYSSSEKGPRGLARDRGVTQREPTRMEKSLGTKREAGEV